MLATLDFGGTKTDFCLWEGTTLVSHLRTPTAEIGQDLTHFLAVHTAGFDMRHLVCGFAGPIHGNVFAMTNTNQVLDLAHLRHAVGGFIPKVSFLNDLEALGYGLDGLDATVLKAGVPSPQGARQVLAVGTGFGVAHVLSDGQVLASEGGHLTFPPITPEQQLVWRYLQGKYGGHVSYERLLSGQGLEDIYGALHGKSGALTAPQITQRAVHGQGFDPVAQATVTLFTQVLAMAASDLALCMLPTGGLYLCGGVVGKMAHLLNPDIFHRAFVNKGRFGSLLESMAVYLVDDPLAVSKGALAYGLSHTD